MPREPQRIPRRGLVHRQQFAATLEVVVGEHRPADARQCGVASQEVTGEPVDEIEQLHERVAVDVHRCVCGVHADAVFVEVPVWGELPEPRLPAERDRHGAQCAPVAAGEAFVLMADRAFRVSSGHGVAGRGLGHGPELRLGQVDRDDQTVRIEPRVGVELGAFDVGVGHAIVVEPPHGLHAAPFALDRGEPILQVGGAPREQPHHDVGLDGAVLRFEQARRHGGRTEAVQQHVDVVRFPGRGSVAGRSVGDVVGVQTVEFQDPVAGPVLIAWIEVEPAYGIADQRVDGGVGLAQRVHRGSLSATSATMASMSSACSSISCTSLICVRARTRLCSGYLMAK